MGQISMEIPTPNGSVLGGTQQQFVSPDGHPPLLALAPLEDCHGLRGRAYVSSAEVERFEADYMTLGKAARALGMHPMSAKGLLDGSLAPLRDPAILGVRLYRRQEFEAFLASFGAESSVERQAFEDFPDVPKVAENGVSSAKTSGSGESDGSIR